MLPRRHIPLNFHWGESKSDASYLTENQNCLSTRQIHLHYISGQPEGELHEFCIRSGPAGHESGWLSMTR